MALWSANREALISERVKSLETQRKTENSSLFQYIINSVSKKASTFRWYFLTPTFSNIFSISYSKDFKSDILLWQTWRKPSPNLQQSFHFTLSTVKILAFRIDLCLEMSRLITESVIIAGIHCIFRLLPRPRSCGESRSKKKTLKVASSTSVIKLGETLRGAIQLSVSCLYRNLLQRSLVSNGCLCCCLNRPCCFTAHLDGSQTVWQLPWQRGGQCPIATFFWNGWTWRQDGRVRPRHFSYQQRSRKSDERTGPRKLTLYSYASFSFINKFIDMSYLLI